MDKIEQDLALCPAPPPPRRVARAEAAAVLQREGTLARMIAAWLLCLMSFFALMFVIQLFDVLAVQTDRLPGGDFNSDILFFVLRRLLLLFLFFLLLIEPDLFGRGVLRFRLFLNLGLFRCEDSTDPVSNIFHRL